MYQDNIHKQPEQDKRGKLKTNKIPIKVVPVEGKLPRKPEWIKAKAPTDKKVLNLKKVIRENKLHTVCEEASCPNLGECFSHGTATFMIMGDICTRRCPFCDVAHGKPLALDPEEPANLAKAIKKMDLQYVVITSVDRDDQLDRGAGHFVACIEKVREVSPTTRIEILVPDFRSKIDIALDILKKAPPDVFNHNLESIPRLYEKIRPGANYDASLSLIKKFKEQNNAVATKSGLMLGLGEELEEVKEVLHDLKDNGCDMVTIGQYLQPSRYHLPVERFVHPDEFEELKHYAESLGFMNVASAPMVRSSYHADIQASGKNIS
ncbi:MAG: lipoyl synthase [Proteobacteria bacterium]|nr:lipoyl synthase [Pseudomonadota bacterium]NOG60298.1 lipoyl synthase [Pseudomonadota bacterium]